VQIEKRLGEAKFFEKIFQRHDVIFRPKIRRMCVSGYKMCVKVSEIRPKMIFLRKAEKKLAEILDLKNKRLPLRQQRRFKRIKSS
jgi:hypothetical protein